MRNLYTKDYFEHGEERGISLYTNYRWLPELTIPMCAILIEKLNIKQSDTILDFGCAKGYMVKAFRLLHREAYGVDISSYAISHAPNDVKPYLTLLKGGKLPIGKWDFVIAKDVFEHLDLEDLSKVLNHLVYRCSKLFCIIPLGENGHYIIPTLEGDYTHKIREPLDWWCNYFLKHKYKVLSTEFSVRYLKENWIQHRHGNGFFLLKGMG